MKNRWHLRVFTKFNDSLPFEREQEDEVHGISQSKIKIVIYAKILQTRRLAACTQAVVITKRTSYIAIELKCSAFEVVRNSIESMC